MRKTLALVALGLVAVVCAAVVTSRGNDAAKRSSAHVFFIDGYESELGMRGRLVPQSRDLSDPGLGRVVAEVLRGPTATERDERGLLTAFPLGVRVSTVALHNGDASVRLASAMPPRRWRDGVYATAQLVYTLSQLDGVDGVSLTVNGVPCCMYDMRQRPLTRPLTRDDFATWQGAPRDS